MLRLTDSPVSKRTPKSKTPLPSHRPMTFLPEKKLFWETMPINLQPATTPQHSQSPAATFWARAALTIRLSSLNFPISEVHPRYVQTLVLNKCCANTLSRALVGCQEAAQSPDHPLAITLATRLMQMTRRNLRLLSSGESSVIHNLRSELNNLQPNAKRRSKKHSRTLTISMRTITRRKRKE